MTLNLDFPKNWQNLTPEEQKRWMLLKIEEAANSIRTIEPEIVRRLELEKTFLPLKGGGGIAFPEKKLLHVQRNPNLVREWQKWLGKWLFCVIHYKTSPKQKYFLISNPDSQNRMVMKLSFDNWRNLFGNISSIGNKYGFIGKKKAKNRRKKRNFSYIVYSSSKPKIKAYHVKLPEGSGILFKNEHSKGE